ncbi:sugar ABC transporter substrate-binding protein [Nonomuraea gerenzanensis]|uniref:Maltose/maltodextrin ABC transporter, substrate binding periplasmic protein MalE n=1 Tax=Nonomuraea gerenzanensis TaxID=93944 RepID=A0A1M4E8J3_9ACTN|nr:maltose ABC transporter substrate-binding protein [Nonomuraea gerenzanensis]UBU17298.1 maltose ABC transporter substrate-binding protein [Nonomuraea gerenzanensis]SBO95043.1 Maltose/maltodextrin ABC transporter, substrate binding periplasmic protein MalE [Nonomuraea gerenzanensis]
MRMRALGVAALATLAFAATACGSSPSAAPTAAPGTSAPASASAAAGGGALVIWADPLRVKPLQPFAEQFGTENGVTVEVKEISKDNQMTFLTASQQGSGPDIVIGAHDWIGNLVQNGAIDPVTLTEEQKASFSPKAIQAVTFNGQIYGAPYALENIALIRNTDLAPDAPATIEEMIGKGKELKEAGKVKEVLCIPVGQKGDAFHVYPIFASGGGALFGTTASGDPDPKQVLLGSEDSVKAFGKLKELGEKGDGALRTSLTNENYIVNFAGGKCAYLVSGPWAISEVKKGGIKYDISAVPAFKDGKPATPFVGVQSFFVASKGKNKALAQEFVANYVTNKDVAKALYDADPRPPALTAALEEVKASDPDAVKFLDAGKDGMPMPAIPEMAAIWEPFGIAENAVVKGGDAAKAATAAQKAIDGSLKN